MALRKKPNLTDILAQFQAARQKEASEEDDIPVAESEAVLIDTDHVLDEDIGTTSEDVAEAAQNVEDAQAEVVNAKETLKAVAGDFINEHNASLKKEAQIFGELFAVSCMEHMNKTASFMDIEHNAYHNVLDEIYRQDLLHKCAAVYDESYMMTMSRIAGFKSPQEFQKAAGLEDMSPEDMAALMADQGSEPDDGDYEDGEGALEGLSEEELLELARQMSSGEDQEEESPLADALESAADAAESNAEAIQAIAEAARMLSGAGADDAVLEAANLLEDEAAEDPAEAPIADSYMDENGDVNLPGIQEQAYANVMNQLGG